MPSDSLQRFAAFTDDPLGGNSAGVWIGEQLPPDAEMLKVAADVGSGRYVLATQVGEVPLDTQAQHGKITATLTSVEPSNKPPSKQPLEEALRLTGWHHDDLDQSFSPSVIFRGAHHLPVSVHFFHR